MFTEPKIFTKSFNKISYPNSDWGEKAKIYCKIRLNLGLGETVVWEEGNAPTLRKILKIYDQINQTPIDNELEYQAQLQKNYQTINFRWKRIKRNNIELRIGIQNYENSENIRLIKNIGVYLNPIDFKLSVFKQLIGKVSKGVRNEIGELLFNQNVSKEDGAKFKIGDYVKTIPGNGVKTEREGYIIGKFFHLKENSFMYKLLINDKIYKFKYKEFQLEIKENAAAGKG